MLITFHSKVVAEVLMLSEHAGPLLHAAGKSFGDKLPERGVFTVEQLGPAIAGLEQAIETDQKSHAKGHDEDVDEEGRPVNPMARLVGLSQRAFPLLSMMKQSLAANVEVTWEVSRGW